MSTVRIGSEVVSTARVLLERREAARSAAAHNPDDQAAELDRARLAGIDEGLAALWHAVILEGSQQ